MAREVFFSFFLFFPSSLIFYLSLCKLEKPAAELVRLGQQPGAEQGTWRTEQV